jgi:hypothetical protein
VNNGAVQFFEIEYTTVRGLPHSKQHDFDLDVISPQFGQILCDPYPATCGFSSRIQWSIKITNSTIRKAEEILIAFINALLFVDCRVVGNAPESACT